MTKRLVIMGAVAISTFLAAGCGVSGDPVDKTDKAVERRDKSGDEAAQLMNKLAPAEQARVQSEASQLKGELSQALNYARMFPDKRKSLSEYVETQTANAERLRLRLPQLRAIATEARGGPDGVAQSASANVVSALQKINLYDAAVASALKEDVALSAAYQRWRVSKETPRPRLDLVAEMMALAPCTDRAPGPVGEGKFAVGGVALGMTEPQVLAAVCTANKGAVRQLPAGVTVADKGLDPFHAVGFEATSRLRELPWTMKPIPPGSETSRTARFAVAGAFKDLQFCFNCAPSSSNARPDVAAAQRDGLFVRLSPQGRVVYILRTQWFLQPAGQSGGQVVQAPAPRTYKDIQGPLEQQFGRPSVVSTIFPNATVGWVYPDRAAALPQDIWGNVRGLTSLNGRVLVADPWQHNLDTSAAEFIKSARPRATFCLEQHGSSIGLGPVFRLAGTVDDTKTARSGYQDRCGVIVAADIVRVPADAAARPATAGSPPLSGETLTYGLSLAITDTDAYRAAFVEQELAARDKAGLPRN